MTRTLALPTVHTRRKTHGHDRTTRYAVPGIPGQARPARTPGGTQHRGRPNDRRSMPVRQPAPADRPGVPAARTPPRRMPVHRTPRSIALPRHAEQPVPGRTACYSALGGCQKQRASGLRAIDHQPGPERDFGQVGVGMPPAAGRIDQQAPAPQTDREFRGASHPMPSSVDGHGADRKRISSRRQYRCAAASRTGLNSCATAPW